MSAQDNVKKSCQPEEADVVSAFIYFFLLLSFFGLEAWLLAFGFCLFFWRLISLWFSLFSTVFKRFLFTVFQTTMNTFEIDERDGKEEWVRMDANET